MMSSRGGLGGFIDKFKSIGLSQTSGWLGNTTGAALTSSQVEQALGSSTVNAIARKVGLSSAAATGALGYLIPKVIGQLTPDGVVGSGIPSSVSVLLRASPRVDELNPAYASRASAGPGRWAAPLLALLALGGLGWYFLANQTPTAVTTAPVSAVPTASTVPSRLAITNDNGVVTFSGTVRDQAARTSIIDTLNGVFGSNAVKGRYRRRSQRHADAVARQSANALAQLNMPGLQAVFDGNSLNLGGTVAAADRDRILGSLKSTLGSSGLTFAAADPMSSLVSDATNKAAAALVTLGAGFQATDLLGILNKSIINFPTGSAEVPTMSRSLLQQAATPFKRLPANTVVEISGYTDNTGDPAANLQLSQHRADAVKNVLVQSGVNPSMLMAKGYGSANPIASNDTADGRFQNRRIEYQPSDRSRATEGSGGPAK